MDQKNLAELYDLEPVPWSRALEALDKGEQDGNGTSFLTTMRPGRTSPALARCGTAAGPTS